MGSDRARVSYEPEQQYRSVVMQQGRVTLEADFNEEVVIAGEELREETLDIVGPSGTPDDGYMITPLSTPPFDFSVSAGTMYVGGLRIATPAPIFSRTAQPSGSGPRIALLAEEKPQAGDKAIVEEYLIKKSLHYSHQTEWLDATGDPDWVDIAKDKIGPAEFVYLFLREQEVSAVEDSDLKDVALGGPDTAQRTRLIQRIVRLNDGRDCASGLATARAKWKQEGLEFDPNTMRLNSAAALQVVIPPSGQTPDPCNSQAQGGYLGADNQLIRVQISGIDKATGNPKFLWGFDDASFLYRIDVDPNNKKLLHLQSRPVDASHQPQANQYVEVLRSAAELSNGEYVASLSGFVFKLDQAYNPDTQMITLRSGINKLPDEYYDPAQTPRVFLRVWQEERVFTSGTAMDLGNTGLQVTLQSPGNVFHFGDYWLFAVRPSTPQLVYPERYLNDFQSPDGPRLWACPLGVIAWKQEIGTLVADCRNHFDNLVNLSKRQQGCCTITVRPEDIKGNITLQSIVDQAVNVTMNVAAADAGAAGNNITVSIANAAPEAGTFDLRVMETNVYAALSMKELAAKLGDSQKPGSTPGLAHLAGNLNAKGIPAANQTVQFTGGKPAANAQASFTDMSGNVVLTLEAKKPGVDGNLITGTISNVDENGGFTLGLSWTKTLPGLTLSNALQSIQSNFAYEITAAAPAGRMSFPAEGATKLTGGAEATPDSDITATAASGVIFGNPAIICLRPGNYRLRRALVLSQQHSNLTIEGCPGGVTISVAKGQETEGNFIPGMIQLANTQNLTLRRLTFEMPLIPFFESGGTLAGLGGAQVQRLGEAILLTLAASLGLTAAGCVGLTIEHCDFNYPVPQPGTILFAAGMLATGDCANVTVTRSNFFGPDLAREAAIGAFAAVLGYVQTPVVQPAALVPSTLFDASFAHNVFENLDIGVLIMSGIFGITTFESNVMRSCLGGIWVTSLNNAVQSAQAVPAGKTVTAAGVTRNTMMSPLFQRGVSIASTYPLPQSYVPKRKLPLAPTPVKKASRKADAQASKTPADTAPGQFVVAKEMRPLAAKVLLAVSSIVDPFEAQIEEFFSSNISFIENDIDAFVDNLSSGGPAIFIIVIFRKDGSGVVNMTANKLRNNSPSSSTVLLGGNLACTVTGNLMENRQFARENISPKSLVVDKTPVVITGNILVRPAVYPPRTGFTPALQPPFNSWDFLNTIIP